MRRHLLRLLINTLALFAAVEFVPGVNFAGPWWHLAVVAVLFGVVNALLRPILTVLTCPLVVLTLGLFTLVINGLLFWVTGRLAGILGLAFGVRGFWAAFFGALVMSTVSVLVALLIRPEPEARVVKVERA